MEKESTKEMDEKGKRRFMMDVEKFVVTRLKPFPPFFYNYDYESSAEERLKIMDDLWKWHEYRYRKSWGELVAFPQLTNHEICHEMFWNAFRGRSKLYIQIKDLRFDEDAFSQKFDESADSNQIKEEDENEVITLQCSLLSLQMLDYDIMMFRAMNELQDEEYREEAQRFYRPYLFSYVAEINCEKYERLKEVQRKMERNPINEEGEYSPYLWMACTFSPDISVPSIDLDGYVVQSASNINKIRTELHIIEDEETPIETVNSILDGYELSSFCLKDDSSFIKAIESKFGNDRLSTIDVYKLGNGNCVYAQGMNSNVSFFYDIGFNYRHRPKKIAPGVTYSYVDTMKKIYAKKPSLLILSHWDMDHIAGSAAAGKAIFDKDWFAPDCDDACIDAQRLAKYLDLKGHLFLSKRRPRKGMWPARLIGQIDVKSRPVAPAILATYRFYMGKKAPCDSSRPNCEGIVIEYTDRISGKVVLMMGDVNYTSFNKARTANKEPSLADTHIDYLIAPHHGSEHTDYEQITASGTIIRKGIQAIICCTNNEAANRPCKEHREELEKRFNVITTEEALTKDNCIRIFL